MKIQRKPKVQKIQKNKLGARILSDSELRAILPNGESVYEQIAIFRSHVSLAAAGGEEYEQKTNNIGIMGCRGAGKTSILRTFHLRLSRENERRKQDVVLPIIVPENMSSGTVLMDVILGMLKPVVEERTNEKEGMGDCIYRGRSSLEKAYDDLVRKYCYIKKDYRDILIQQFTTEQLYVDKTKEVFNSDTEFIRQFHYFVNLLFAGEAHGNAPSDGLLFLFIDDIDLSTTRCTDVVKTLLSYLSHPRIVTFISGDTKTFEEALALDFLRQEQALDAEVFAKTYCAAAKEDSGSTLLERKKTLANEYLKKIIPPAYRRTIKYWSLEERGKYAIQQETEEPKGEDEGQREAGEAEKNLAQLLTAVTGGRLKKSYFTYEDQGKTEFLPVAFHLFDDTSRGLNNVYTVLLELYEKQEFDGELLPDGNRETNRKEDGGGFYGELWRLVETIVDAKPLYAKYKEQLLQQMIVPAGEGVKVDFLSALHWLYPEKGNGTEHMFTPDQRFALFLLIDVVSGLFFVEKDEAYRELKNKILAEYVKDESIEGRFGPRRGEAALCMEGKSEKNARWVLRSFLTEGSFLLDLYLVQYLGRDNIYRILGEQEELDGKGKKKEQDRGKNNPEEAVAEPEQIYRIAYSLMKAVSVINAEEEEIKEYLASLYLQTQESLTWLLDQLPLHPEVIYGERLLGIHTVGRYFWNSGVDLAEISLSGVGAKIWNCLGQYNLDQAKILLQNAAYENEKSLYWIYYEEYCQDIKENGNRKPRMEFNLERMQNGLISRGLIKTCMSRMKPVMDKYRVKELSQGEYDRLAEGQEEKKIAVIRKLDEEKLWKRQYVKEKVEPYLQGKKRDAVSEMKSGRQVFDATAFLKESYRAFETCYKGSTGKALANRLKEKIDLLLWPGTQSGSQGEERMFLDGNYYMELEQVLVLQCIIEEFLFHHPRIQYGKREARQLLMELRELPLVLHTDGWQAVQKELQERESVFLHKIIQRIESVVIWNPHQGKGEEAEKWNNYEKKKKDFLINAKEEETIYGKKEKIESWFNLVDDTFASFKYHVSQTDYRYYRYAMQKEKIDGMKQIYGISESDSEAFWKSQEQEIPIKKYLFYLHALLRYHQENDSDAAKAGAQADDIAKLVAYLLESELIADHRISNEIYEALHLEQILTEEEFESLF